MKHITEGGRNYPNFVMPAAISPAAELPESSQNCYAVIFWKQGTIILEDDKGHFVFHGAGVLCISCGHTIKSLSFQNEPGRTDGAYTLVFKPDSLNTSYSAFPNTAEYNMVAQVFDSYIYRYLAEPTITRMEDLCKGIDYQMNVEKGPFWPCLTRSYMLELLILIERTAYTNNSIVEYSLPPCDEQTKRIFQYIHTSYFDDISLNSLAKQFGTNRTTLNDLFKAASGMTVMAYLGKIRMTIASLFLQNTTLSVQDISRRVGLQDEAYFSRLFKTRTGLSPREFRIKGPHPYGSSWSAEQIEYYGNS